MVFNNKLQPLFTQEMNQSRRGWIEIPVDVEVYFQPSDGIMVLYHATQSVGKPIGRLENLEKEK